MTHMGIRLSGFLIMIGGIFLLLNMMGFAPQVGKFILIALAIWLILKGFLKSGLYRLLTGKMSND